MAKVVCSILIVFVPFVVIRRMQTRARLNRDLLSAVQSLDSASVDRLLAAGASANVCQHDAEGSGILQRVLSAFLQKHGDPAIVLVFSRRLPEPVGRDRYYLIIRSLIEHGADSGARSAELGKPALEYAITYGTPECVRLFLARGALKRLTEEEVSICIALSDTPTCELLLLYGANANSRAKGGMTALMAAQSPDKVDLLLRHGADPYLTDSTGRDAMSWMTSGKELLDEADCAAVIQELRKHGVEH